MLEKMPMNRMTENEVSLVNAFTVRNRKGYEEMMAKKGYFLNSSKEMEFEDGVVTTQHYMKKHGIKFESIMLEFVGDHLYRMDFIE